MEKNTYFDRVVFYVNPADPPTVIVYKKTEYYTTGVREKTLKVNILKKEEETIVHTNPEDDISSYPEQIQQIINTFWTTL